MHRVSRSSTISSTRVQVSAPDLATSSHSTIQEQRQAQVQDAASRKDWSAVQNILTAHPDTFQATPLASDHPKLILDVADTRELGDFVEHLPPDAHLPTVVVRGASLVDLDQRITRLTAHRHSHGLRLENCHLDWQVVELLAQGAQEGQALGHVGLRELGWTNDQTPTADELFGSHQPNARFTENQSKFDLGVSNLDEIIRQSPHLEAFALSGIIPIGCDEGENNECFRALLPSNLMGALASTPLKRLDLHNFYWVAMQDTEDQDAADWKAWASSPTVSLDRLHLSHWCMGGVKSGDNLDVNIRNLLGATGIRKGHERPFELSCAHMPEAGDMGETLGKALRERNSALTVQWTSVDAIDDDTWAAFSRQLFAPGCKAGGSFDAPLVLHLDGLQATSILELKNQLPRVTQLKRLTATADCRNAEVLYPVMINSADGLEGFEKLLDEVGNQPLLESVNLDQPIDTFCQMLGKLKPDEQYEKKISGIDTRIEELNAQVKAVREAVKQGALSRFKGASAIRDHKEHITELKIKRQKLVEHRGREARLQLQYAQLKQTVALNNTRDEGATHMVQRGFDLGYAIPMDRDVSAVIARQFQGARGDLGNALLPLALTNQYNYQGWRGAQAEPADNTPSVGQ